MTDKKIEEIKNGKKFKKKFFAKLFNKKRYIWELEQTNDLLQKKINEEKSIRKSFQYDLIQKDYIIDKLKEKINSIKRSIESNPWKVFELNDDSVWFRPNLVSLVSDITKAIGEQFQFSAIIQGESKVFLFDSLEKAKEIKAFIVNVDTIPKTIQGEVNVSSPETHDQERENLLKSLKQNENKE